MNAESAGAYRRDTLSLLCRIHDVKVLRRVWKILDRAYNTQEQTDESGSEAESRERIALIGDIGGRLMEMDVEQLRRVENHVLSGENLGYATTATDKERINAALCKLPPEDVRDILIFSETLLKIFESR